MDLVDISLRQDAIILLIGLISGIINTISGGGSFLTLPILILMGLPPQVANGSNRISIILQSIVSSATYYQKGILDVEKSAALAVPTILGSLVGAWVAVELNDELFKKLIGIFMLVTIALMLVKPKKWIDEHATTSSQRLSILEAIVFFIIGIYGGFIQAGVGVLLLAGMAIVSGINLKYGNAIKMALSFIFNVSSFFVFLANGLIHWEVGLVLAAGSMSGAWIGTLISLRGGAQFTRWALMITMLFLAGRLLNLF